MGAPALSDTFAFVSYLVGTATGGDASEFFRKLGVHRPLEQLSAYLKGLLLIFLIVVRSYK
jgi:preprotein translocase subunit SecG